MVLLYSKLFQSTLFLIIYLQDYLLSNWVKHLSLLAKVYIDHQEVYQTHTAQNSVYAKPCFFKLILMNILWCYLCRLNTLKINKIPFIILLSHIYFQYKISKYLASTFLRGFHYIYLKISILQHLLNEQTYYQYFINQNHIFMCKILQIHPNTS